MSTRSVTTAIHVLEAVAELQPVGLSELSRAVEVPKATVQRVLVTLEELQWIERAERDGGKWSIAVHAYAVTSRGSSGSRIRDVAIGPLSALQLETGETIHLAVPDELRMVVIERLDTPHVLRAFLALGSRIPMHASATGLTFLAHSSEEFVRAYLQHPLAASTPDTMVHPQEVQAELKAIRSRGYSINPGGLSSGITAIGAALISRELGPVGSISVSGPSSRITPDKFQEYGTAVAATARQISMALPG
ncbi:IclR family transcriptional regulator [Nesterenkonia ebinurensis]|uniref:IclR family transcriptional regulator n=1 Tax=Nesterenkonia ebinurensis TaxID=2608252 RepID=UPI00123DFE66|nr:IclR family transcriptional regulator [Nesterenkonia ebinurensis]